MIIILLILALLTQAVLHHIERKDLYNRIMSKDLTDYNHSKKKSKNKETIITKHQQALEQWRKGGE